MICSHEHTPARRDSLLSRRQRRSQRPLNGALGLRLPVSTARLDLLKALPPLARKEFGDCFHVVRSTRRVGYMPQPGFMLQQELRIPREPPACLIGLFVALIERCDRQ